MIIGLKHQMQKLLISDISVDKSPAETLDAGIIQTEDLLDMAKKSSVKARKKAVKKLDKAVKKAVKKGVSEDQLEQTVNDAKERAVAKQQPVKQSATRASGRTRKASASAAKLRDEDLD